MEKLQTIIEEIENKVILLVDKTQKLEAENKTLTLELEDLTEQLKEKNK
jgi:hypothetical protein